MGNGENSGAPPAGPQALVLAPTRELAAQVRCAQCEMQMFLYTLRKMQFLL